MAKNDKFIRDLISDIEKLSRLLILAKPDVKDDVFQNILKSLRRKNRMEYDSDALELKFNNTNLPRHLSHANIYNLRLYFSVDLNIDYRKIGEDEDPFERLEFNIYAYGVNQNNRNGSELVYSLHFDRHIFEEGNNPSKEVHPMYHFQFGGRKLKEKNIDMGQALFFDAPRIMHHPMEFIIGLDFVLSNFFPDVWEKLQIEGEYINILKKYQEYFILPYYKSVVNYFDRTIKKSPWNAKEIYPQLVKR
jgi:hypothetical protein